MSARDQPPPSGGTRSRIDFRRYRKLRRFVARTFLHAFFWDFLLAAPLLSALRRPAVERWRVIARRYRALAVEMGGVLIKLGQFLSVRVDLLPPEVIGELAGLQDEVPAESFAAVVEQIEADFGRPVAEVFPWLSEQPVGAASLAQVHRARLADGTAAVVKVLRPGVGVLVETDLAAVALAVRLGKAWRRLRRRVDLDRLEEEIAATTRRELDLHAEGQSAERFARAFSGDAAVAVPRIFWQASAPRTLALENVGYLKINDFPALAAAGIERAQVARTLYRIYMQQIFVHRFVHADPHPGNLFVQPLPVGDEAPFAPGDPVPPPPAGSAGGRPFRIVFVDFGMVSEIPEPLGEALSEYLIGLATRDAARVVRSYRSAGVLLPGADLHRLEEVHEALFERFWGVRLGDLRDVAMAQAGYFFDEYRDLLYDAPFQMQVDLLFVSRAVGLLAGMGTQLDPAFDPWAETLPFAERLAARELKQGWREGLRLLFAQGSALFGLPRRLDTVLLRAERGTLTVQAAFTPDARRTLERLNKSLGRLSWTIAAAALLVAGALLHLSRPGDPLGTALLLLAGAVFLGGMLFAR